MNFITAFKNIQLWFFNSLKKLFLLRATPHEIAFGAAVGVFIGIFPTFGLGGIFVIGLAPLIKFNIPAAFIGGTLLNNPILAPLWIFLSCWIVGIDFSTIKQFVVVIAPMINFSIPAALAGSVLFSIPVISQLWIIFFCIFGIDYHLLKITDHTFWSSFQHYSSIIGMYVAGNAIVSSLVSLVSYGVTYWLIIWYRKRRERMKSMQPQSTVIDNKAVAPAKEEPLELE